MRSIARFSYIGSPVWTSDSRQIYFKELNTIRAGSRVLRRIDVRTGEVSTITDLSDVSEPDSGWYGLTPDGSPLTLRCTYLRDIYAISVP